MRATSRPAIWPGVLGRLALRVVEVRGHGDDRLRHRLAEVLLRRLLQLLQDHRGDFRRRVFLAAGLDADVAVAGAHDRVRHHLHLFVDFVELAAHEALDREHGVLGVGDGLTLGDLADQPLAGLGEADDRRRDPAAFRVGDDDRLAAFHHRHHGVGRAQVDSDDLAHVLSSSHPAAPTRIAPVPSKGASRPIFITFAIYNLSAVMSILARLTRP